MNFKSTTKLLKPVIDWGKKSAPVLKMYSVKALGFINQHRIESGLTLLVGLLAFDDLQVRNSRNNVRKKNKLYQEVLRKHQAEINALKNAKEREEYKNRLLEELMTKTEGL